MNRAPRWTWFVLGLIVVLAAILRFDGLDRLLPHFPEPDNHVATQLAELEAHVPPSERENVFVRYPLLMASIARLLPSATPPKTNGLPEHLRAANDVTLRLRTLSAVAGIGSVLLTFFVARRFLTPFAALFAAFLVATSLLALLFSQQARPHSLHAFCALLAVWACVRAAERSTVGRMLAAGTACGLALASLQSGIATVLPLITACVIALRSDRARRWTRIALAVAPIVLCAWLFYPHTAKPEYDGRTQAMALDRSSAHQGGHVVEFAELDGSGFALVARYLWEHDPTLFVGLLLGLVWLAPRMLSALRTRAGLVIASYCWPYFLALGLYHQTYERFLLPLLPCCACLAAYAVERIAQPGIAFRWMKPLWLVAAGITLAGSLWFPLEAALRYRRLNLAPDTLESACTWIVDHTDPSDGKLLVSPGLALPIFYARELLPLDRAPTWPMRWVEYQLALPDDPARGPRWPVLHLPRELTTLDPDSWPQRTRNVLDEAAARYAVLEISPRVENNDMMRIFYAAIRARAERIHVEEGEAGQPARTLDYQDLSDFRARLFGVARFGPRIEIYRFRH